MQAVPSVLRAFGLLMVLAVLALPLAGAPALAQTEPAPSSPQGGEGGQGGQGGEGADVDIDVGSGGGGSWYSDPFWIVIGAIAVLVVLVLAVAAGRGNGATIVKT